MSVRYLQGKHLGGEREERCWLHDQAIWGGKAEKVQLEGDGPAKDYENRWIRQTEEKGEKLTGRNTGILKE